jgi:hypothetical protein
MHTQTIFELSQEAERLLQLALQNLDALKSMPIAVLDSTTAAMTGETNNVLPLHFSTRGVETQLSMLNNELRKITRRDHESWEIDHYKCHRRDRGVAKPQPPDDRAADPDPPHAGPDRAGAAFRPCVAN